MPFDQLFLLANSVALLAWTALILLPRWRSLRLASLAAVAALCVLYSGLVMRYFFGVAGGGFFSLPAVQQLFTSAPVALAGWVHYLAFDLCMGWWIAGRCDAAGISRWLQAPLLATTFMFGPVGLLLAGAALFAPAAIGAKRQPA